MKSHHHAEVKADNKSVNINTATAKELTTLKGVGPKKAQAIVSYRQQHGNFKSSQDLAAVKGIGKKAMLRIVKNNAKRMVVIP